MIVKGAPNKEQTVKFLNYMISPEAQARFHQAENEPAILERYQAFFWN